MKKAVLILNLLFVSFSFGQTIALQSFATGFSSPVEITHPVNDSRLFVVQQRGLIRILNSNGSINSTPFLSLVGTVSSSGSERGLLGLAFHPNYASNGYFYVNYTRLSDGATVISRFSVSSDPNVANTTETILMIIPQPYSNHNGGSLKFGPDGYLYIGMGDGGSAGDPENRAQNINENLGKMLRIDVDNGTPYGIPATNPYVGVSGNDEIWAIGVRNPWKFSFNRLNGDLWIADVGQNVVEEIDKIPFPLPNTGLNFGWRCYEGTANYNTTGCVAFSATVAPFAQYTHASTSGCSITGGYYYTGSTYPNFQNKYFFADYCTNKIGTANDSGVITWTVALSGGAFTTFGEDKDGELYIASAANGTVYKIIDSSLGLNNFNQKGISFYPNPAKTEIFITNKTENLLKAIKVFDLTGKLVLKKSIESNENPSITISTLSSGLYMVAVEDETGNRFQSKLIVE